MKEKVLVIIVSYNFEHWIDKCLGGLRESEYPVDVLVIDNASQDDTTKIIRTNYPEVHLIENDKNLGFGCANNIGMRMALDEGYDFVFLLNQDAWIDPKTIGRLVELANRYPEYGILSPVHLNAAGKELDSGFAVYSNMKGKEQCMSDRREVIEVKFINAAFWMLPRKTLDTVGGFSPLFYHYGEDIDYVNRTRYHGMKIGYAPDVTGYHDREFRIINDDKFQRAEYVYHLSEYVNINHSFIQAFAYSVLACIKKSLKGNTRYLTSASKIFAQSREVLTLRKNNKNICPNYIG